MPTTDLRELLEAFETIESLGHREHRPAAEEAVASEPEEVPVFEEVDKASLYVDPSAYTSSFSEYISTRLPKPHPLPSTTSSLSGSASYSPGPVASALVSSMSHARMREMAKELAYAQNQLRFWKDRERDYRNALIAAMPPSVKPGSKSTVTYPGVSVTYRRGKARYKVTDQTAAEQFLLKFPTHPATAAIKRETVYSVDTAVMDGLKPAEKIELAKAVTTLPGTLVVTAELDAAEEPPVSPPTPPPFSFSAGEEEE